jgi:hypothetical protein
MRRAISRATSTAARKSCCFIEVPNGYDQPNTNAVVGGQRRTAKMDRGRRRLIRKTNSERSNHVSLSRRHSEKILARALSSVSGDLDPGVLVYLIRENKFDGAMLEDLVDHHSGLLGISGVGSDILKR